VAVINFGQIAIDLKLNLSAKTAAAHHFPDQNQRMTLKPTA
jgi:hypothetical protein